MIGAFRTDTADHAEIIAVYVTKEQQGTGVTKALLTAILHELRQHEDIRTATLAVNASQVAAIPLYTHAGFQVVGTQRIVLGDGMEHEELLMEKLFIELYQTTT
jgi:ribosomal protein S18 acetylase RimI-like enzyme